MWRVRSDKWVGENKFQVAFTLANWIMIFLVSFKIKITPSPTSPTHHSLPPSTQLHICHLSLHQHRYFLSHCHLHSYRHLDHFVLFNYKYINILINIRYLMVYLRTNSPAHVSPIFINREFIPTFFIDFYSTSKRNFSTFFTKIYSLKVTRNIL